jgi:hypothetical protein
MANFDDFADVISEIERKVLSARAMRRLGDKGKDIVFRRVKSGFGVDRERSRNPRKKRLKPLSAGYIQQRQREGVSGSFGSSARSNLTNTGQMLDSFEVEAKDRSFRIIVPNTRRRDGKLNSRVAQFVSQDRPFLAMTRDEQQILRKEVENNVRKVFLQLR